jgi:hypothetical protein
MAAKRVDPQRAKEAKQKKIAIGLVVLLVGVLVIQGPKMLKMLKGSQPPAAAETVPGGPAPVAGGPAPVTGAPATGGPAAGGPAAPPATGPGTTGATATPADLASVPNSDQAPVVDVGQLATFERFSTKDPFAQQAQPVEARPAAKKPATTDPATEPTKPTKTPADATDATDGGFTTGGGAPSSSATVATATSIAVNGVAEDVTVEVPFPVAEPTFVLVSVAKDGKSVEIGIDGGEYANGGETITLALGKKLTLQNTADGSRYELELRSIKGFPLPTQKG